MRTRTSTRDRADRRSTWPALLAGFAAAVAALLLALAPANAQPTKAERAKAKKLYKQGKKKFDLGQFEEAVTLFKEAYELSPSPALIFNIGQAYRQMDSCKEALFFYRRYLTFKGTRSKTRKIVKSYIKELSETCKAREEIQNKPPLDAVPPEDEDPPPDGETEGSGGDTEVAMRGEEPEAGEEVGEDGAEASISAAADTGPTLVASSLEVGPTFLDIGNLDISGAQVSVGVGAGYPLNFGKASMNIGGFVTYTPVPWDNGMGLNGTSALTSLMINIDARYWLTDKLAIRGSVGAGGMFLSGLAAGNVFLNQGDMATGALTMLNLRGGAGIEFSLTENLVLSAVPAYSYSPAKSGLRDGIDAFARIELMAGLGYRL